MEGAGFLSLDFGQGYEQTAGTFLGATHGALRVRFREMR